MCHFPAKNPSVLSYFLYINFQILRLTHKFLNIWLLIIPVVLDLIFISMIHGAFGMVFSSTQNIFRNELLNEYQKYFNRLSWMTGQKDLQATINDCIPALPIAKQECWVIKQLIWQCEHMFRFAPTKQLICVLIGICLLQDQKQMKPPKNNRVKSFENEVFHNTIPILSSQSLPVLNWRPLLQQLNEC